VFVSRSPRGGDQRHMVVIRSVFEVQQEVGTDAVHQSGRNVLVVNRLVLENDTGDVNRGGA
jgi:hypothetical protein